MSGIGLAPTGVGLVDAAAAGGGSSLVQPLTAAAVAQTAAGMVPVVATPSAGSGATAPQMMETVQVESGPPTGIKRSKTDASGGGTAGGMLTISVFELYFIM